MVAGEEQAVQLMVAGEEQAGQLMVAGEEQAGQLAGTTCFYQTNQTAS